MYPPPAPGVQNNLCLDSMEVGTFPLRQSLHSVAELLNFERLDILGIGRGCHVSPNLRILWCGRFLLVVSMRIDSIAAAVKHQLEILPCSVSNVDTISSVLSLPVTAL
jgi:hypothetical protein